MDVLTFSTVCFFFWYTVSTISVLVQLALMWTYP